MLQRRLLWFIMCCALIVPLVSPAWADDVASVTAKDGTTTSYTKLHEALEAARTKAKEPNNNAWDTTSVDVNILKDITFEDTDTWTPVTFDVLSPIIINGNGHKITNLPDMLYQKSGSGVNTLTINDLTFVNPKTTSRENNAVIVGYLDSGHGATFKNVHIQGAKVTVPSKSSNYAGAFVGYAAGWNKQNDGPVYQHIIFENCSLTDSEISAPNGGAAGGLIAHAAGNPATKITITGTTVANNKITGSDPTKTGAVFGTLGLCGTDPNYSDAAAYICAEVYNNEVTSGYVIGRNAQGGTCYFTRGGKYDVDPTKTSDPETGIITTETGCVVLPFSNESDEGPYTVRPPRTALTITAKDQSIVYGDSISKTVSDVTCIGLNDGHTLSSITLTPSGSNVTSNGAITPSGAVIKNSDVDVTDDYKVTYVNGKLTITEPEPEPEAESETDDSSGGGSGGVIIDDNGGMTVSETETTDFSDLIASLSEDNKLDSITSVTINDTSSLTTIQGLDKLTSLKSLDVIGNNTVTNVDLSSSESLTNVNLQNCTSLTEVKAENCTNLQKLDCSGGSVEKISLQGCDSLTDLSCQNNNLEELDVSECPNLTSLDCSANNIGSLNVEGCENLTSLNCGANNLSNLSITSCRRLEVLYCYSNNLTELNVQNSDRLYILVCDDNSLNTLNVEQNKKLKRLDCQNNAMPVLDITSAVFQELQRLKCYGQNLSGLSVTQSGGTYSFNLMSYMQSGEFTEAAADVNNSNDDLNNFKSSSSVDNVSGIKAYDADGNAIEVTSYESGVISFASKPSKIVYDYDTGYNNTMMDVTISEKTKRNGGVETKTETSSGGGGGGGGCDAGFGVISALIILAGFFGFKMRTKN